MSEPQQQPASRAGKQQAKKPRPVIRTEQDLRDHILDLMYDSPYEYVTRMFQIAPTEQQTATLKAMGKPGAHVTVRSGRGVGKSTVMAWLVLWFVRFRKDVKVACTAPSASQLRDVLWPEIAKWHVRMCEPFKSELCILSDQVVHIRQPKTRFAVARTSRKDKPEALQGIRATNTMYLVDEASGVDEEVFVIAEGSMTLPGARVLLCGNPTRSEGYFFDTHKKPEMAGLWKRLHFSSLDSPLVDKGFITRMRTKYGEQHPFWKIHVLGEFPDVSADILIPYAYLEKAKTGDARPYGERVAGLDVARFGDDRSALVIRQGNVITAIQVWSGYDTVETAKRALSLSGLYDTICVDEIGVGGGAVDVLRSTGKVRVVPVNVSQASTDPQFSRLRDVLWFACRDWVCGDDPVNFGTSQKQSDGMSLVDNLVGELAVVRFGYYQGTGRVKVESKDDMKKRLHYSPDIADALCLTFAVPHSARGGVLGVHRTAKAMGAVFGNEQIIPACRCG